MVVSRRPGRVGSLQDLHSLFTPLSQHHSPKETEIMNTQQTASQATSADAAANELLAQALEQLRTARAELGQQVAEAQAASKASIEQVQEATAKLTKLESVTSSTVQELTGRINDLEKAAAAAANATTVKKPIYKRALEVTQQVGGVAAFVGGIAMGGKLAYDRFINNGDSAEA